MGHIFAAVLYLVAAMLSGKAADYSIKRKFKGSRGVKRVLWGFLSLTFSLATLLLLIVGGNEMLRKIGAQYW